MLINVIRHSIRNRGGDRLILDYLAFLASRGHQIVYWTNEVNTDFTIDTRIHIERIPVHGVWGTILFALTHEFRSDVLIVDLVVMALFASLRNKGRILYVAQGFDLGYHKSAFLNAFIHEAYKIVLNKLGTPTISVSERLTAKLSCYQPKALTTVANGIDLAVFYKNQDSQFLKFKQKRMTIVVYGRTDYQKGFDVAVKAISEFRKIYDKDDWELWLIGEETAAFDAKDISVKSFGFLGEKDLRDFLSAADIFLSPSRHEGFGLLQLQALACGCMLVATDCLSYVEHDVHALLSPIGDSVSLASNLQRAVTDIELRQRLKANARVLAQQYSLEKSCRQFEAVIQSYERNSR